MAKKKQISKTEKKLRGKLQYREKKIKKIYSEMNEFLKEAKTQKIKSGKKTIEFVEVPENIRKKIGVKKNAKKETIQNAFFKLIYKERNLTDQLETTLRKRFKKSPKVVKGKYKFKKGEIKIDLGHVWEVDKNFTITLRLASIKTINKLNKRTDLDKIINQFNDLKLKMSSKDKMLLLGNIDYILKLTNPKYEE